MNATTNTYNLLLFGSDLKGQELQDATNKLAQMLQTDPERAKELLDKKGSIIGKDLKHDFAIKAKENLAKIGINSNIVPVGASQTLELAAVEKTFECPNCKHKHVYGENEDPPKVCKKCDVVFAKYEKVLEEEEEKQAIKKRLMGQQQRKLDDDRKIKEQEAKEKHLKQLEAKIRKELGIPSIINSKLRLATSAAGIHLVGILLGFGIAFTYYSFTDQGNQAIDNVNDNTPKIVTFKFDPKNSSPDEFAQRAISQTLELPNDNIESDLQFTDDVNFDDNAGNNGTANTLGTDTNIDSTAATFPTVVSKQNTVSTLPSHSSKTNSSSITSPTNATARNTTNNTTINEANTKAFLENKLATLETDAEWDYFLLTTTNSLLAQGKAANAIKLVNRVGDATRRFERGARLLGQLWNRNQTAAANKLYQTLTNQGTRLTGGPIPKIKALCTIARYTNNFGRSKEANPLLQKAQEISRGIINKPQQTTIAEGEIAALLTIMGHPKKAGDMFSIAVNSLKNISNLAQKLSTVAHLAITYAKAGYRASALNLLEKGIRKASTLSKTDENYQAIGELAKASAQLMDIQMALHALNLIKDVVIRDRILYQVIQQEILFDRLAQATDLASRLREPTYTALAYGFLGLRQRGQVAYQGLAATSLAQSDKAANAIKFTGQKSAVLAELGRFAKRSGNARQANRYFAKSLQLAKSLTKTNRDFALALLAANHAQAQNFKKAKQILSQVKDASIRHLVTLNTNNWQQTANIGL